MSESSHCFLFPMTAGISVSRRRMRAHEQGRTPFVYPGLDRRWMAWVDGRSRELSTKAVCGTAACEQTCPWPAHLAQSHVAGRGWLRPGRRTQQMSRPEGSQIDCVNVNLVVVVCCTKPITRPPCGRGESQTCAISVWQGPARERQNSQRLRGQSRAPGGLLAVNVWRRSRPAGQSFNMDRARARPGLASPGVQLPCGCGCESSSPTN